MADNNNKFKEELLENVRDYFDAKVLPVESDEINGEPAIVITLEGVAEYAPADICVTFIELSDRLLVGFIVTVEEQMDHKACDDIEKLMPLMNNYLDTGAFVLHKDDGDLLYEQFWNMDEEDEMINVFSILLYTMDKTLNTVQDCREILSRLFTGDITVKELLETEEYITQ